MEFVIIDTILPFHACFRVSVFKDIQSTVASCAPTPHTVVFADMGCGC